MKRPGNAFIIIITVVVTTGILFAFFINSKKATIRLLKQSIENISNSENLMLMNRPENVNDLQPLFPDSAGTTEFIEKAYITASKYGIDNLSFNYNNRTFINLDTGRTLKAIPSSGIKPGFLSIDSIKVSFTSDYRSLAEFVREIQNFSRLVTIEEMKAYRKKSALAVDIVAKIYSTEAANALK